MVIDFNHCNIFILINGISSMTLAEMFGTSLIELLF